jgi:hypothetical protein
MNRRDIEGWIRDELERQGEIQINDQLEMHLPEAAESKLEWNYIALVKWANLRILHHSE